MQILGENILNYENNCARKNTFDLDQYDFQPGGRGCTKGSSTFSHVHRVYCTFSWLAAHWQTFLNSYLAQNIFLFRSQCFCGMWVEVCVCVCVYVNAEFRGWQNMYMFFHPYLDLTFATLARHCMYALLIACKHHKHVRASGHTQHWMCWYYLPCQKSKVTNHRVRLTEDHLHLLHK
jgi:hypothetical protein